MQGFFRSALLALSPRHLRTSCKNLVLWLRLRRETAAHDLWHQYFDAEEYRREHSDVARAKVDPWLHFLLCGNAEFRNPSERFDVRRYLTQNQDVKASGVNALLHFVLFGNREGRVLSRRPSGTSAAPALFINNDWRRDYPLVSVVIPCFNYGQFVESAIRSVLDQTFPDFEVIVVEGGSTDPATIAEVRRLESMDLPKTRFYYRGERHFAGDNRNFGISMARGRYICCLDADDLLHPIFLEVAVFLAEVYGYDVVTSAVQSFGESDELWLVPEPTFPEILDENQVATSALFRRSAWAHVGGFRDWGVGSDHVHEDWDFWIRVLGHGYQGTSIREALLLYRVHSNSLTNVSKPDPQEQRKRLQVANASLTASAPPTQGCRSVINPWTNLGPLEEDDREGVLFALPFVTIGGAETLFRTIGQRLASRGHRLLVTTSITLPESVPENISCFRGVTAQVYHLSRLFRSDDDRRTFLFYLIRRNKIRTMMIAGSEFVYRLLPDLKREFPELRIVDQLFNDSVHVFSNRQYSDCIDATVVPSEEFRRALVERHGSEASSVHVIPHGIVLPASSISEAPIILKDVRHRHVIVGFFGRMSEEKAPDLFVEIARKLAVHRDLFFVMTGEGPEREDVLRRIQRYDLTDRIYTPGFVDDVLPLMRSVDIVVLPSRIDGMPLAVLECQALGKVVVASRVGSLPAMIDDGKSGFLCEPGDVDAFCRRILDLAQDPTLRERMQTAALHSLAERHGAEHMLKAYEHVFSDVRGNRAQFRIAGGGHDSF
jgi:O-antigen biosynthesis protein